MSTEEDGLIDTHLHLQDEKLQSIRESVVATLRAEKVDWWGVNSTSPHDWEKVASLAVSLPEVFPFFGVHPWKVNGLEDCWEKKLVEILNRFPGAGIGEIGLDRWIQDHDIRKQKEIFDQQLELAVQYRRPVTVHCLQAWGSLAEILEDRLGGLPFLLHSFGGPVEMVPRFLDLGAYFSISGYFFRKTRKEKLDVFRSIPGERILLETDAPDMLPPQEMLRYPSAHKGQQVNHPGNLPEIYQAYAAWRGCSADAVIRAMRENCRCWLDDSFRVDSSATDP